MGTHRFDRILFGFAVIVKFAEQTAMSGVIGLSQKTPRAFHHSVCLLLRMSGDSMMKSLKWILLGAVLALLTANAISGTFAADTPADFKITLSEWQRIEMKNENTGTDNLEPFEDFKLLVPIHGEPFALAEKGQMWNETYADQLYSDEIQNVVDKFVFVKNEGTTPALVRVWFAFEQGAIAQENFNQTIGWLKNDTAWWWDESKTQYGVEIEGNTYVVMCAVYSKTLEVGSLTTNPSLLQVWMHPGVSAQASQMLDGNKNGTYDIRVLAQGVQYVESTEIAALLDGAYGKDHPWKS